MKKNKILKFIGDKFDQLGPGFITGAADDDPSGIATYSIAGAQFGYKLNWLSLFLTPLMISIQEMCGRIGIVSGMGLAGAIGKYYSKKLLYFAITLLSVANIINIGADLGFMAACLKMITGIPFLIWLVVVTVFTILMEVYVSYERYSKYLKWMGLTLLVYGVTAFLVKHDWLSLLKYSLIPHLEFNLNYLLTMVAFLGTTISPYLFFWQASEEVEEEIKIGRIDDFNESHPVSNKEILTMKKDTTLGMFFSNLITFFIVITTAATLHVHGFTDIETPHQAAEALRPLAGDFAYLLFTLGIVGIGLQSIPILASSVAYAFSETFGFKEGLSKSMSEAKVFYIVIGLATFIGVFLNFIGINSVKALYYAAIINCIAAVPLIAIIIRLADNKRVVGKYVSSRRKRLLGWATFSFMAVASGLMIFKLLI